MKTSFKNEVIAVFNSIPQKVFLKRDIARLRAEDSRLQKLLTSFTIEKFIERLKRTNLKEVKIVSPNYGKEYIRFVWGDYVPIYQIALSLKSRSYLCHHTAMYLHGLSDITSKTIYVNSEQSVKEKLGAKLEQGRIDMAFQGSARTSKYIFNCHDWQICCLNGINTKNLGIEEKEVENEGPLLLTSLERTMIDIVVRPTYAMGCNEVLAAYEKAKGNISVDVLIEMLKKINYTYPYHQAIGFYMEYAGYGEQDYNKLKNLGLKFDFYLDYKMPAKKYSNQWRIYYPADLLKVETN